MSVPGDDEWEATCPSEELLVTILLCLHLSEVLEAEGASKVKLDWRPMGKPLQAKPSLDQSPGRQL